MHRVLLRSLAAVGLVVAGLVIAPEVAHAAAPTISLSSTDLDFGSLYLGDDASIDIVITNTGNAPVSPNFSGGAPFDATNYGASQNCAGTTLDPGDTCTFTYTFNPTTTGSHPSSITLTCPTRTTAQCCKKAGRTFSYTLSIDYACSPCFYPGWLNGDDPSTYPIPGGVCSFTEYSYMESGSGTTNSSNVAAVTGSWTYDYTFCGSDNTTPGPSSSTSGSLSFTTGVLAPIPLFTMDDHEGIAALVLSFSFALMGAPDLRSYDSFTCTQTCSSVTFNFTFTNYVYDYRDGTTPVALSTWTVTYTATLS